MSLSAETFLILLSLHFIGDFVSQSNWMAQNKSKRVFPLLVHVAVYGAFFIWFGFYFAAVTAALHFIVDFISSRISSYFWKRQRVHGFFVVIGADQLAHYFCLYLAWRMFK